MQEFSFFLSPIVAGPQIMRPAEIANNLVVPCTGGEFACAEHAVRAVMRAQLVRELSRQGC
jgi:hypothetical protein